MKFQNTMDIMSKDTWYWGMIFGFFGYSLSLHYGNSLGMFFSAFLLSLILSFTADRLANSK